MRTHIARWGNSLALRIPRRVAEKLGVGEGGDVELTVEPGRLVVRPGPRRLGDAAGQPGQMPRQVGSPER